MSQYSFTRLQSLCVEEEFFECEMGLNLKARVTTAPVLDGDVLTWTAVNAVNLKVIEYRATRGMMHYGPHIYSEPQYITIRGGEMTYDLLGEETTNG